MAPEQAQGRECGPAVDVFSWGATVAFGATGRMPSGRVGRKPWSTGSSMRSPISEGSTPDSPPTSRRPSPRTHRLARAWTTFWSASSRPPWPVNLYLPLLSTGQLRCSNAHGSSPHRRVQNPGADANWLWGWHRSRHRRLHRRGALRGPRRHQVTKSSCGGRVTGADPIAEAGNTPGTTTTIGQTTTTTAATQNPTATLSPPSRSWLVRPHTLSNLRRRPYPFRAP